MFLTSDPLVVLCFSFFFFQAEDGIRDYKVTGVQTCALPIWAHADRRVRLVARAVELGGAALPRTERHRTCPLRHPQGGPRARAAALSRSAALGSRACGARSHPDVSRGAPA